MHASSTGPEPGVVGARAPATGRFEALDVLRGAAVAGMLLVTMPGDWADTFPELRHADWNGCTLADLVFPAFLFSAGVALGLSMDRIGSGPFTTSHAWGRVLRRAVLLVLIGLALEATYNLAISAGAHFPGYPDFGHLRLPGILQRIGLCYALAASATLLTARPRASGRYRVNIRAVSLLGVLILIGYALLLRFAPVPGFGAGRLDAVGSLPAYLDRQVFAPAHLWALAAPAAGGTPTYDPEGLLSTLPATTDMLLGILIAEVWRRAPRRAAVVTAAAGLILVVAGLALAPVLPINKRLWTSSFALFTGGVSALALALAALLVRRAGLARLLTPFVVLGRNAILAFVLATVLSRLSGFAWVDEGSSRVTPQAFGDHLVLRLIPQPELASLACAAGMTALIACALWPLHRRRTFLRL